MNERIKLLAEQAREYAAANAEEDWEIGPDYQDLFEQKFAELVVLECEKLNRKQSYELSGVITDTEQFGGFDLVCLDTVKRVEQYLHGKDLTKHFGVDT